MVKKQWEINRVEQDVRKMSREGAKPSEIIERINYERGYQDGVSGAQAFLNRLEYEFVIKPLGGIAHG